MEGLEGPKRPRCICFFNNVFRGSKLIHGYIVSCGRLLECLRVIVRRVLEGSWRVLEGLGGSGGYGRVREGPVRYRRVWECLGGSLRVRRIWEDPGGSSRVLEGLGVSWRV